MDQTLRHEILSILEAGQDLTLATLREDGFPQATTVSYASDGLSIYFGCSAQSQKARNLARDPRVSLTVDLPYEAWSQIRGLSIGGTATRLTAPDQALAVGRLFVAKFPELGNGFSLGDQEMALFCITPLVISVLDYRKGFGHVDHVEAAELETAPVA
ncbi:pyridoxamine 5'-phosphate oxidase [Caulobacter sp. Root1455]|uniref:pyridoxamine 5'-phosphate oxidase family protein n=1 Tax=unclassified Caulobacter TaxID=2648921 RepID=UPI0006F29901|nr:MULTISPECIES: pyridoxamine 5'-phosphate oxidase family protein [unclassified Caulobacter]KQY28082.1 pyridoxamine 5'-phosphate oxidase [Caulobacter sp. Root487D2Y]KQZ04756.1 pyridoxamine 5'-phosphate oxidase [Caulobacter sp. Root1455]